MEARSIEWACVKFLGCDESEGAGAADARTALIKAGRRAGTMTDARAFVSETCLPCPCEGGGLRQPAHRPGRAVEADEREQNAGGAHAGVQSGLLQLLVRHDFSGKVLAVMLAGHQTLTGI